MTDERKKKVQKLCKTVEKLAKRFVIGFPVEKNQRGSQRLKMYCTFRLWTREKSNPSTFLLDEKHLTV